ncbi:MAG: sporulation regulator [Lentisphaerae bacterium]|jgi:bifunctional DNA-binding transcriptional regulator/antitoxin component of YhaV-PrlF toxin-antitoxin module|nr:sporulation regulator [Kiritimatiellia bacterium]NLC82604.1 sporulation regulator [Lentisphaerota bacterium]
MSEKNITVLTERGQISMPSFLRKKARLATGQRLAWRQTGDGVFSVTVVKRPHKRVSALEMIGYAKRFNRHGLPLDTDEAMKVLREGET